MKKIASLIIMLSALVILCCSSAAAYEKEDKAITQVSFTASGNVTEDKNVTNLNVSVPKDANYSYAGFETVGTDDTGVHVKLNFTARNKYYFRIIKASQIRIPEGIAYVSAAREDNGYSLVVEVALPTAAFTADTFHQGWIKKGDLWYYMLSDGFYAKQWKQIDGDWYYFDEYGQMAANKWIAGEYYVGADGRMLHDTITPDGYKVGSDGKWIREVQGPDQNNTVGSTRTSKRTGLYYWTENGNSYHLTPDCPTLKRSSTIHEGNSIPAGYSDPCNVCAR